MEAVEAVSEILARVAPGGIAIEPAFKPVDDGLAAALDPTRPAVLHAYLSGADASGAQRATEQVRRDLGHLQAFGLRPIGDVQVGVLHEVDWAEAWKRHFPLLRAGRRLVIRPPWRRYRARDDEVVVVVDPGQAFGTGLHPTTRLCLEGVERWADRGRLRERRVLDLGCGSGILAIAAARLGADSVVALDTDPIAVEATESNARRNRLTRSIRASRGTLPAPGAPFDLVIANLIASLLVEMAAQLHATLRGGSGKRDSGGVLLCSGIYVDREPEVRRALAAAGFHIAGRWTEGDWVALEAERID